VKALLKRYAERIDAASLRERAMIFLALALGLVFVANAALIEPLRVKQKRLTAENQQRQQELQALQAGLQRLVQGAGQDTDSLNRARQKALREELARFNAKLEQEQRRFTAPDRMRAMLGEMFERNKQLTLVDLKTLPVTPLGAPRAGATNSQGLFRHGIELTVSGAYLDLYEYLRTLERMPAQLYWGRAELSVGEYPSSTLKLTLYTLSFDRAWLIV
jgi:MSHA biogenesis protein MshJ